MKANELMIGDVVKFKEGKYPFKKGDIYRIESPQDFVLAYRVMPIPLTEEILKANGFVKSLFSDINALYSISGFELINYNEGYASIVVATKRTIIHNVHELQHALRVCGLNELADNLKLN